MSTDLLLSWPPYRQFAYERQLAVREATALLEPDTVDEVSEGLIARGCRTPERASELVYFSFVGPVGRGEASPTRQALLELSAGAGSRRQPTRYASHGLHEYKGKFNPQTAHVLLNLAGLRPGEAVLDPYCGSGTTLAEAALGGATGLGLDINPLAVLVSETKAELLRAPVTKLAASAHAVINAAARSRATVKQTPRTAYLASWFPEDTLVVIERLDRAASSADRLTGTLLRLIASDLLRDYSLQEPADLRIRRRRSPLPSRPILSELADRVDALLLRISAARRVMDGRVGTVKAVRGDITKLARRPSHLGRARIGAIITSPPYAMALPYIDTQRLSLVWLGLIQPSEVRSLDASLTGSREIGTTERRTWEQRIMENSAGLPTTEAEQCRALLTSLGLDDGMRKRAVPALLYRYFEQMQSMFVNARSLVDEGVPYFLVVGHNRTTIGGKTYNLDTPSHLANLALQSGWWIQELVPLETYQRFGIHARNAVESESLIWLRSK